MEQEAADFEPHTMEDLAFKVIFADSNGVMCMTDHQKELAIMAYQLVGLEARVE